MHFVLDGVLRAIDREIAAYEPERGGAILGPVGEPIVTRFVFDTDAETTGSTYRPSRSLNAAVQEIERRENLEFKGVVHSHPGNLDRPSGGDEYELRIGLAVNPHLPVYLLPIVTRTLSADLSAHEVALTNGKISFYGANRRRDDEIRVRRIAVTEVPMQRDLELVATVFGGSQPEVFMTSLEGVEMLGGRVVLEGGVELLFIASELYPAVAPLLLVTPPGGQTEQMNLEWSLNHPAEQRLVEAIRGLITPPGPYRLAYGPRGGPALTSDRVRAHQAGWLPRYTAQDPVVAANGVGEGIFARSHGLLSSDLRARRVLVVGLGSGGSFIADQLVRSGVGGLTLIDPEVVECENLSRTVYGVPDLGVPKPEALTRRLLNVNPLVEVIAIPRNVLDLEPSALDSLVCAVDLVVAATDEPAAQLALNRFAYARGKPALFGGLYAGAQGGEVVISVPGRTPCYLCGTSVRHGLAQGAGGRREVDYGSGRLKGEVALGVDIHHVSTTLVKLALSLLLPADGNLELRAFAERAVTERLSYLTLSMVPSYWFYPSIFGDTPGQYAYQAVWLTPEHNPECPACGEAEWRVDPLDVPLRPPDVSARTASTGTRAGGIGRE